MLKNKIVLCLLLSILSALLYSALFVVDFPRQYPLIKFQKKLALANSSLETTLTLEPYCYLMIIKHKVQGEQSKEVIFNKRVITPFNKRFRNSSKKNVAEIDYFLIQPDRTPKNNSLKINFSSNFPEEVVIRLQNYRHAFAGNNIVVLFKPAFGSLFEFRLLQSAVVFLLNLFFFATILFHLEENSQRTFKKTIFNLSFILAAAGAFNLLPFIKYDISISVGCFLFCWASILIVSLLVSIRKELPHICANGADNQELQNSNKRRFVTPLFFFLMLLLFMLRFFLVLDRRIPIGHDTFQYLQFQYLLFFNEPALHKSVPQWLPFLTHGSVSNFWISFCQGIFTSVIVPFAGFLKHVNFYCLFQAGLLFDELILLFGCVMLAKRHFKSVASTLFVTSSIVFTTISSTQIWWDFHLIYLFPVTIYCFERALRDISAKYLFLACLFFMGMMLGNPPYCLPLFGFTILVFGLTIWFFSPPESMACLKRFVSNFRLRHLLTIVIPCILALVVFLFLKYGTENIVPYKANRSANWQVNGLTDVLNYGGYINLTKYIGFISRGTNNLDNTVYAGLLLVPFMLMALLRVQSRLSYAFGSTAVIMALFSAGIVIPAIFYYAFPLAKYYRHIGLIVPLVKFFAVFYAGFGFDEFWQSLKRLGNKPSFDSFKEIKLCLFVLIIIMLFILISVLTQRLGGFRIFNFPVWASVKTENQFYISDAQISSLMTRLILISGLFSILLVAMLWWPKKAVLIGYFLASLHLIDVGSFKAELEIERLPRVDKKIISLFDVCDYSFSNNRSQDYFSNPRFSQTITYLFPEDKQPLDLNRPVGRVGKYGVQYWNIDTFLFFDPISHIFLTQRWEKGVGDFYRIWTLPLTEVSDCAGFPIPQTTAFKNLCGHNFPKLQLFSRIHALPSEKDVAEMLASPYFQGDMLLTSDMDSKLSNISNALVTDSKAVIDLPSSNERIDNAGIIMQEFSFDKLRLQVNNETKNEAVLYYADAWHPQWHAYINGRSASVFKTNLAYKSVIVPPGRSDVVFEFGNATSKFLFNGMIAIGIFMFFGLVYCMFIGLNEKD